MAGGHGPWGTNNDYLPIFEWIIITLIIVTLIFDLGVHKLGHWLDHKAGIHRGHECKITDVHAMYSALLNRYKSEMMVLGFLAFVVWICNVGGFFHAIVQINAPSGEQRRISTEAHGSSCGGDGSGSSGSGSGGGGSGSGSGSHAAIATAADFYFPADPCAHRYVTEAAQLLHIVEAAHMVLFLTMTLYFLIQACVVWLVHRDIHRVEYEERAIRRGLPIKYKGERALVTTMKRVLLEHARSSPSVAVTVASEGAALQKLIDAGKLNITEFVDRTSETVMGTFLEFQNDAWIAILMCSTTVAIVLQFSCIPATLVPLGFFAVVVLVALAFSICFAFQKRRLMADQPPLVAPSMQRALWPLMFVGVPFSFGYVPWQTRPLDNAAVCAVQMHVFIFCHLTMWAWADTSSSWYYTTLEGPMWDGGPTPTVMTVVHAVASIVCLCAVVALERACVFTLAFPPYVSATEERILLDVLQAFPDGNAGDDARGARAMERMHGKQAQVHPVEEDH